MFDLLLRYAASSHALQAEGCEEAQMKGAIFASHKAANDMHIHHWNVRKQRKDEQKIFGLEPVKYKRRASIYEINYSYYEHMIKEIWLNFKYEGVLISP